VGKSSLLNLSEACKGRREGKWSIETRSSLFVPALHIAHSESVSNTRNQRIRDDLRDGHFKGGLSERRIEVVNRQWVQRVEIVTTDVHNDREPPQVPRFL